MLTVDALVSAGGRDKPGDPLYPLTQGRAKALLELAGKPMVQWVLDALAASPRIGQVVLVGLDSKDGLTCGDKPLAVIPDAGGMVDNVRAGAKRLRELHPASTHALWVGADVPALRAEHITWLVDTCLPSDHDLYYTIIEQASMVARFPESRRSYTKLKGHVVCGGDCHIFAQRMMTDLHPLWKALTDARKNVFKQASLIGFEPLWLLATGQLTIERAEQLAQKKLHIHGRALLSPYAEMGMDVDKPWQYELMVKHLKNL
jgi:GTP:adenosylcobinamide-phosphate guanylyltransferase